MNKKDEELLTRVKQEHEKRGLVLGESVDEGGFHKVMERLACPPKSGTKMS